MLILIEGCDGVGKSTLVDQLSKLLPAGDTVEVIHRGQPKKHPLLEYENDILHYAPRREHHIIGDRWHWGELVYAPIYRDGSLLGEVGRRHVDLFLNSRGAVMVHLTADEDVVRERLAIRGEDYLEDHHIRRVLTDFGVVSNGGRWLPMITVKSPYSDAKLREILHVARVEERNAPGLTSYIGHPSPDVLIVGNPDDETDGIPFVPYPDTPAHLLISEMRRTVRYGFTTAEDPIEVWLALDARPRVVALGSQAASHFEGLHAGVTHHPAEFLRRKMMTREQYGRTILGAAYSLKDIRL